MPYKKFTKIEKGKKKFCMKSLDSGRTYCYSSAEARAKAMRIHEMFKHTPKSKIRIAENYVQIS